MKYYISDLHLFHENAIAFDPRPFASLQEMHDTILKKMCIRDRYYVSVKQGDFKNWGGPSESVFIREWMSAYGLEKSTSWNRDFVQEAHLKASETFSGEDITCLLYTSLCGFGRMSGNVMENQRGKMCRPFCFPRRSCLLYTYYGEVITLAMADMCVI